MNMSLLEMIAVVVILSLVGVMLVRAFAASRTDGVDVFKKVDARRGNQGVIRSR